MWKVDKIEDERGGPPLRVTHRKGRAPQGRRAGKDPSIRVRCGCCSEAVEIFYSLDSNRDPCVETLEIAGVIGTVQQWREVLCPMLGIEVPKK